MSNAGRVAGQLERGRSNPAAFAIYSAAANGNDDFQLVPRKQRRRRMLAFRHDFTIALDGNPLAGIAEQVDQAADGQGFGKLARNAIEGEF